MTDQAWQRDTVGSITAPPELLAREALMQLADRVAERAGFAGGDLLLQPARTHEVMEARWIFLFCASVVLGAKNWQVAMLCGWERARVAEWHSTLHEHVDEYQSFRDRLDRTARMLARDTAWKRPLRAALKAHRLAPNEHWKAVAAKAAAAPREGSS